jgi:hypothetical protein
MNMTDSEIEILRERVFKLMWDEKSRTNVEIAKELQDTYMRIISG